MYEVWFKDPFVLFEKEQLLQFIPDQSMSFTEQINAVMRFVIYFSLILLIVKHDYKILYFPIFVGFITWIVYSVETRQQNEKRAILEKLSINKDKQKDKYCTIPTNHNPYMNVLMNEYQEFPSRPEACNVSSSTTQRQMKQHYSAKSYRDVDDIFEKKSGDRQFYTVASTTIPNKQKEFAEWLYTVPSTCKESGNKCII